MSVIENYVQYALNIAADNSHGYDQGSRWGPNYDCSSLVITAVQQAGILVKDGGATYTGNMKSVFGRYGFRDVANSVNLSSGAELWRGDILLNEVSHTAIYIGNGQIVHASINELGRVTGGRSGDQTGREICVRSYYDKPWNVVLRYTGGAIEVAPAVRGYLMLGDAGPLIKEMQQALIEAGYSCGKCGADGDFGRDTEAALLSFQADYSLEVDGKYGPISKAKLREVNLSKSRGNIVYVPGQTYTLQAEMMVRTGPGTNYRAKSHGELTVDGRRHDSDGDGALDRGTRVTCLGYQTSLRNIWVLTPSGWIAGYYGGHVYIA